MSKIERSKQRVESFFHELEQKTASFTDEELVRLERIIMESRGRAAAHVVVAPIGTAQPLHPRSRYSEISFDVHVCMDPEPADLEPSLADTGFEAPGQQCLSNWEMERTTIDGVLPIDGSSSLGENILPWKNSFLGRRPIAKLQHRLPYQKPFSCR